MPRMCHLVAFEGWSRWETVLLIQQHYRASKLAHTISLSLRMKMCLSAKAG